MSRSHVTHQLSTPKLILPQDPFPPLAGLAGGRLPGQFPEYVPAAGQGDDATTKQRSLVIVAPPTLGGGDSAPANGPGTITFDFGGGPTPVGALLTIAIGTAGTPPVGPPGWTQLVSTFSAGGWVSIYATIGTGQATGTFLATSPLAIIWATGVWSLQGLAGLFDVGAVNSGSGTAASTGATPATAQAIEIVIGAVYRPGGGGSILGGGFSLPSMWQTAGANNLDVGYVVTAAIGSYNMLDTLSIGVNWVGCVAAIK